MKGGMLIGAVIALKIKLSVEQTRRFLEAFVEEALELAKNQGGENHDSRGDEILDQQANVDPEWS